MDDKIIDMAKGAVDTAEGWAHAAFSMLPNLIVAVVVAMITAAVTRRTSSWSTRVLGRKMSNKAVAGLLGRMAGAGVALGGLFTALTVLHLDKAVTSMLAGVGVAGVALGFALQETASNYVAGLLMAINHPFGIGDIIRVSGFEGVVEAVELSYTQLKTYDGLSVSIPNRDVFKTPVTNLTKTRERRVDVDVGVAYGDDLEKASAVLREAAESIELRDPTREVDVLLMGFGDSSIDFQVHIWLEDPDTLHYLRARSQAILAIKRALDDADLHIPFPIRTLDFGADAVGGEPVAAQEFKLRSL